MIGNVIDSHVPRRCTTTRRPPRCRSSLMVAIVVLVSIYVRRAGTEELV